MKARRPSPFDSWEPVHQKQPVGQCSARSQAPSELNEQYLWEMWTWNRCKYWPAFFAELRKAIARRLYLRRESSGEAACSLVAVALRRGRIECPTIAGVIKPHLRAMIALKALLTG